MLKHTNINTDHSTALGRCRNDRSINLVRCKDVCAWEMVGRIQRGCGRQERFLFIFCWKERLYRATVSCPSLAIPASGIICATMIKWNLGLLGRKWESSWVDCYVDMRSVWLLVNRMRGGVIPLRGLSRVSIRLASNQECESELEWGF